ncbi:hypothetical protein JVU11DRAFT_9997 [Chiua virens]|nr:hypothetical protein JVU11DRAFT_9997 [Chiua virens]
MSDGRKWILLRTSSYYVFQKTYGRFQRDMSLSDWETFSGYSSQVRSLSVFERNVHCRNLGNVLLTLSQPPNYAPLVPNIQILDWTRTTGKYVPTFQVLLHPYSGRGQVTVSSSMLLRNITAV